MVFKVDTREGASSCGDSNSRPDGSFDRSVANDPKEPVAIIGVGCRLPGNISTVEGLFDALREGRDCITEIPAERWNVDAHYDSDPLTMGKTYVRHGGFISDVDRFDPAFFGISDVEASRMDPQQRIAAETVWHALEHAGQSADELVKSNTGVFVAMMNTNTYWQLKTVHFGLGGVTGYDAMGDALSIAAGQISHFLGVEGPCYTVDTACSGSMVALHLARQSILAGECDTAIVLGSSVILTPFVHVAFSKLGLMSRSGRCKAFDEAADGYVRSEGCVAVVLRRKSLALARNDRILASIVATAVNQDGRTPALTAPNGQTQEKVIRLALARIDTDARDIGYVEAHGTGTPVGDPIEMSALVNVYGAGRADDEPLYVGSAKSNFGHIKSGAGLLGIVKAALSLDQGIIFPSVHFKSLNPNIDLGGAPVRVPSAPVRWPRGKRPRLAGVNSFGYSGTNAHTILREAPIPARGEAPAVRPSEMLLLSAKSRANLQEVADRWIEFLDQDSPVPLRDVVFTAAVGRAHFRHRLAVVAPTKEEIAEKLQSWREGRISKGLSAGQSAVGRKLKTAFVFTGQGAQYAGMGKQLYDLEPRFKAAIDRCAAVMDAELGVPLCDVLFGPEASKYLDNTRYVQPATFAIEYALADLLRCWGVTPDFVIGHSVGEIVAACVADLIDFEGAARFVVARGRLMGQLPPGGKMLALDATPEQVQEWLAGKETKISVAAINGPHSVVVSGDSATIEEVAELAVGARAKELEVSHAFHSPLMEPILEELHSAASALRTKTPAIPIYSNVTGDVMTSDIGPDYWSSHVRQPVQFYRGVSNIVDAGCTVLFELGPHPALTPIITSTFDSAKVRCIPSLTRDRQDVAHILETLAAAYARGVPFKMDELFSEAGCRRTVLPLYPFRRDRHWLGIEQHSDYDPTSAAVNGARDLSHASTDVVAESPPSEVAIPAVLHPLLGRVVSRATHRATFETDLAASQPWVDHRILGATVFPGAAYLEMAVRGFAASQGFDWMATQLHDVGFERPLVLGYGKSVKVALNLETRRTNGKAESNFVIGAVGDGNAGPYCRGRVSRAGDDAEKVSVHDLLARINAKQQIGAFYGELRKLGFEYGAGFSTIRDLWLGAPGSGEAIARVTASPRTNGAELHPFVYSTVLDGSLQVFGAAMRTLATSDRPGTFVPRSIKRIALRNLPAPEVWSHATVRVTGDGRSLIARIRVMTEAGDIVADIDDMELRPVGKLTLSRGQTEQHADPERVSETREQIFERLQPMPRRARVAALSDWLVAEVKDILGGAAEEIDLDNLEPSTALLEIGLDSLLVTELQRRIQEKLEFRFKAMQGLDYQTIETLAEFLLDEVLFAAAPPASAKPAEVNRQIDN